MKSTTIMLGLAVFAAVPQRASAWGDDGHKTVAVIAQHYLTPVTKAKIDALLAADTDNLTKHGLASEATWADKYRDSNNRRDHYQQTQQWHFVDMEIEGADIGFGRFPLPAGTLASNGDAKAPISEMARSSR
jgi:nuclease S1